ncbi:MAG TPA: glycosyltransferase family 2 protein [Chthoniobacterales bacterium]
MSTSKNRILILTPTLGRSEYLQQSIDAVAALSLDIIHILVCPGDKLVELRQRFPKCRVAVDAGKAGGIYGALNAGLAAADASEIEWDWFTYINDDDLLTPGFEKMVKMHCRGDNLGSVAYGDIQNIDGKDKPLGRQTVETNPRFFAPLLQQGISPAAQQGMLFGAPVVRALQGFRLQFKLCADLDFWARAHALGFPFSYYSLEVGQFRIQAGQLSGDTSVTRKELDTIIGELFKKQSSGALKFFARTRYRIFNIPRYIERYRRLGRATSSYDMLSGGGKKQPVT